MCILSSVDLLNISLTGKGTIIYGRKGLEFSVVELHFSDPGGLPRWWSVPFDSHHVWSFTEFGDLSYDQVVFQSLFWGVFFKALSISSWDYFMRCAKVVLIINSMFSLYLSFCYLFQSIIACFQSNESLIISRNGSFGTSNTLFIGSDSVEFI